MDLKKVTIGTLVGLVVLYALGYAIWLYLFADFFAANEGTAMGVDREVPIQWPMIVGTLLYAKLITMAVMSRGADVSLVDGAKVGVVIGILVWGTADFILYGLTNLNTLTGTIADTLLEGVRAGIAGAIVALVLSKVGGKAPAATAA